MTRGEVIGEVRTIRQACRALRDRTLSSTELVQDCIARADTYDARFGVYLARFDESALAAARQADRERADGIDRGPLHGVPVAVKDTIATEEGPTTGSSTVDYPRWREPRDAAAVARLRAAGAIITGKLSAMEFAIGVPDPEKPFPIPHNPWNFAHYPGGSSTGCAAGVVAGLFLGALGSDTAGSIRIPAAYCGVTGVKGTYGLVPNTGTMPLGPSLDALGPITRTADDAAVMLGAMAGHDPADPTSSPAPAPELHALPRNALRGLRVGVERRNHLSHELADQDLTAIFEAAVADLSAAGAAVTEVEIPHYREITDSVLATMYTEGLACHHRALREQWQRFGRSARLAFAGATLFSAYEYIAAQKVRRLGRQIVGRLFDDVDLIVCPTTATAAPANEGLDLSRMISTLFTNLWSGIGGPAASVPMGFNRAGLPVGLQIAGPPHADRLALAAAMHYQCVSDWHTRTPPLSATTDPTMEKAPRV